VLLEGDTTTVTLTREVVTAQDLVVTLTGSSSTQVSLPPTVRILAGEASATFTLAALDDTVAERVLPLSLTASALDHVSATGNVSVSDNDTPQLTFSLNRTTAPENQSNPAFIGTLRRSVATPEALTVRLDVSHPLHLLAPATVVIPAGLNQAEFAMNTVDNSTVDGDLQVTVDAWGTYSRQQDVAHCNRLRQRWSDLDHHA
jgi:hypothetical protein